MNDNTSVFEISKIIDRNLYSVRDSNRKYSQN